MCHVTSHASCLGERDDRCHTWQASVFLQAQATQSPLCRRLAAVQRSRRLAEVWWQVMVQAFNWHSNASLPQMCRLQMRLQANADPQESRDPPADADRLFTKTRGRGLLADPLQHLPMDSDADADLWSKSTYWRRRNIWASAPLWWSLDGPESTEFITSQSLGTKHYVPMHLTAWRTSIKQHKYL